MELSVAPTLDAPHTAGMGTAIVNRGPSQQPHRGADPADAVCLSEREVAALAARGVLDDHRMIRHLRKGAMGAISGLDRGMQVRRPIAHARCDSACTVSKPRRCVGGPADTGG